MLGLKYKIIFTYRPIRNYKGRGSESIVGLWMATLTMWFGLIPALIGKTTWLLRQ